jgi:hypothetical protein
MQPNANMAFPIRTFLLIMCVSVYKEQAFVSAADDTCKVGLSLAVTGTSTSSVAPSWPPSDPELSDDELESDLLLFLSTDESA